MRALIVIVGIAAVAAAQQKEFTNWPAGTSPQEVGKKVAQNMLPRWIPDKPSVHYAEDSTWYEALEFAKLTKDQALTAALVKRFDPWRTEGRTAEAHLLGTPRGPQHLWHRTAGVVHPHEGSEIPRPRQEVGRPAMGEDHGGRAYGLRRASGSTTCT